MGLVSRGGRQALRGCVWLLVALAVDALSALLSPARQRWPDRLAGIVTVRERAIR